MYPELNIFTRTSIQQQDPSRRPTLVSTSDHNIPPINADEVRSALKDMKKGKTPGEDETLTDVLKEGGEVVINKLADLFKQ